MIVPDLEYRDTLGFLLYCGKLYVIQIELGGGMYKNGPVGVRSEIWKALVVEYSTHSFC